MLDIDRRRALFAASGMGLASITGQALIPTKRLSDLRGPIQLETNIPHQFADWRIDRSMNGGLVNPQSQTLLKKLYTDILERTYINAQNKRIMLSVAYGGDQSDPSVQLHYPELCYPAQGFKVLTERRDEINLSQGQHIIVKRLETNYAGQRPEAVTYWTMMGDVQSLGLFAKRLAELHHGLRGEIVDGTLIRVSSINQDSAAAFALQDRFITDLVAAMPPEFRHRMTGF